MANIVNNYASTIVTIYQSVIKQYEWNLEVINQTQAEQNDILHEIELSAPKDLYHGWLMYRALRDLRTKRRIAKEENEILKEMYEFLLTQPSQTFKNKLQQIQGNARKVSEMQESRTYKPREREDLTIADKHTKTKSFEAMMSDFNKNKARMQGGKMRK